MWSYNLEILKKKKKKKRNFFAFNYVGEEELDGYLYEIKKSSR